MQNSHYLYRGGGRSENLGEEGLISDNLVYRIEVQIPIKMQAGGVPKINKRAVRNKHAGETSCKN